MVRAPYYDKNGVKKGAWSKDEDETLIAYIQRYGHPNWRQLPRLAGLARCGKSCRLRWMNYLRPNLKHGDFSREEEELIIKLHEQLGNKWSLIAERLPGRTDNEIKNYWHSHLKKCLKPRVKTETESTEVTEPEEPSIAATSDNNNNNNNNSERSCSMSTELESCCTEESSSYSDSNRHEESTMKWYKEQFSSDFWTEPFILEDAYADYYAIYQAQIISGEIDPYVSISSYSGADLLYQF